MKISLENTLLETDKPFLSKSKADILSSSIREDDCLFGSALVEDIGLCLGDLNFFKKKNVSLTPEIPSEQWEAHSVRTE